MAKGGRLTETERKKILELHKKGVPATKIAQELDRSPSTVRRVIKGA